MGVCGSGLAGIRSTGTWLGNRHRHRHRAVVIIVVTIVFQDLHLAPGTRVPALSVLLLGKDSYCTKMLFGLKTVFTDHKLGVSHLRTTARKAVNTARIRISHNTPHYAHPLRPRSIENAHVPFFFTGGVRTHSHPAGCRGSPERSATAATTTTKKVVYAKLERGCRCHPAHARRRRRVFTPNAEAATEDAPPAAARVAQGVHAASTARAACACEAA